MKIFPVGSENSALRKPIPSPLTSLSGSEKGPYSFTVTLFPLFLEKSSFSPILRLVVLLDVEPLSTKEGFEMLV